LYWNKPEQSSLLVFTFFAASFVSLIVLCLIPLRYLTVVAVWAVVAVQIPFIRDLIKVVVEAIL